MLNDFDRFFTRIKDKETIQKIYSAGKTITSPGKKVKANYNLANNLNPSRIRYAVTISSRAGSSVWRNRFKRLIREAIFSEKENIKELMLITEFGIDIIFSPAILSQRSHPKIYLKDILPEVSDLIEKLKKTQIKTKKNNQNSKEYYR
jgi:ribonuclease P protein component